MKKIYIIAIISALSLMLVTTGCASMFGTTTVQSSTTSSSVENLQESSQESSIQSTIPDVTIETKGESSEASKPDKLYVADAAMYRGEIIEIKEDGSWLVKQAEGRNFGAPELVFVISENTNFSKEKTDFVQGDYVEIFYGTPIGGKAPEQPEAIAVNKLLPVDHCIYNGVFETFIENNGKKSMLLHAFDSEDNKFIFNIGDDTNIYLTTDNLKNGDKISIYHKGIATRSIPPQGIALEIAPYFDPTI